MVIRDEQPDAIDRPDITEIDGLEELADNAEAALKKAEQDGEDVKWIKIRLPLIAVDFISKKPESETRAFYREYLAHIVPPEYEVRLIGYSPFGCAIEIYPRGYQYVEIEMGGDSPPPKVNEIISTDEGDQ